MSNLEQLFDNAVITFSKNCVSGLVDHCECWRCRESRGEIVTEETEAQAAQVASRERKKLDNLMRKFMKRRV